MKKLIFFIWLTWVLSINSQAQSDKKIIISEWLKAGNAHIYDPVFHDVENTKGEEFEFKELLKFQYSGIREIRPDEDEIFEWDKNLELRWTKKTADKSGFIYPMKEVGAESHLLAYYVTYIDVKRWMEVNVKVACPQLFRLYIDGEKVLSKKSIDKDKKEIGDKKKEIKLEPGKHILLLKTICPAGNKLDWKFKATIKIKGSAKSKDIKVSTKPKQKMDINHLLNETQIKSIKISSSGELISLKYSKTELPEGKSKSWIEIRKLEDNSLVQTFRNSNIGSIKWSPAGNKFSYKIKNSVWIVDLDKGIEYIVLDEIKDLGNYTWSPDGSFMIYSVTEKPDKVETGLKKLEGMPDRWSGWRNRSFLYKVDCKTKVRQRLTYGNITTGLQDISEDGKFILFSWSRPDFTERPYSKQTLFMMNLETMQHDSIWTTNWEGRASFSPDGKKLLVIGGPSLFEKIGENLINNTISNNYDNQAYIYDLKSKEIDPITLKFNPSINQAYWDPLDNNIYFTVTDSSYRRFYKYEIDMKKYSMIVSGVDVIGSVSVSKNKRLAVYLGSGISSPRSAYLINLETNEYKKLYSPRKEFFEDVEFGKTESWNFKNKDGLDIDGMIYYPPKFNASKKYPMIVYYYGGTSPTSRSFGGRYPKSLYAAQGYVVYVLQPSGAVGYGQEFSAAHVNNWGITVADEIINGTKKMIETHPFIDKEKVGCIGASYGGFMTMLLQTRTDIFAAAISHAGISSISSYWGEGYWGYLYSSEATANSFPWNNKQIYIDQSPLFNADKINTPLLLLHGKDDTNVPPGESIQLYTALKLLGKPVEYIEISGQNHHIVDYKKRVLWTKTILAWFDKWLKDQPEWWDDLYPEGNF